MPMGMAAQGPSQLSRRLQWACPQSSRVGGQGGDIVCGRCMEKVYRFGILATGQYEHPTRKWLKLQLGEGGPEYQAGGGWSITRSWPRGPQPLPSPHVEFGLRNQHAWPCHLLYVIYQATKESTLENANPSQVPFHAIPVGFPTPFQ